MGMEITDSYRNSRRNASVFSGISIAWSAAQFELEKIALGAFGEVSIISASIPLILIFLCIYSISRCTIEYMMQKKEVRRWGLAQVDYRITLYLTRLALLLLAASMVVRSLEMVAYITIFSISSIFVFIMLAFLLTILIMPIRMFIRENSGRVSVASAAFESLFWSLFIVGVLYILFILFIGLSYIQPFSVLGIEYSEETRWPIVVFSFVSLLVLFGFFLDDRFLKMVFAFVPLYVETEVRLENGHRVISLELNPEHPEYEKHKVVVRPSNDSIQCDAHVQVYEKNSRS